MTVIPALYPANDLVFEVTLKDVSPTTGVVSALTTGTVTGFLSATNTPTATAADPSLSVSGTHKGSGKWLIAFDATALTATLLASSFASGAYLIVTHSGGIRVYAQLAYTASRPATVT